MITAQTMKAKCATCPFRDGSPVEHLRPYLAMQALTEESRYCHSTGGNDIVIPAEQNYSEEPMICRGARDLQLELFHKLGVLDEPTDEAWQAKCSELIPQHDHDTT